MPDPGFDGSLNMFATVPAAAFGAVLEEVTLEAEVVDEVEGTCADEETLEEAAAAELEGVDEDEGTEAAFEEDCTDAAESTLTEETF